MVNLPCSGGSLDPCFLPSLVLPVATYPDLMHRTHNCASLSPFTDWRDRTTESRGSKIDLRADSSRHIRSMIRDGMVKAQQ